MEGMELIELSGRDLEGFPLYLRKIYFNQIVSAKEEMKLMSFSPVAQTEKMCSSIPVRRHISKTVNWKILNSKEHGKQ